MAAKVEVIVEAVDKASKKLKDIGSSIEGVNKTLGETDQVVKDFGKEMRGKFADALGDIEAESKVLEQFYSRLSLQQEMIAKRNKAIKETFLGVTKVAGGVALGYRMITSQLDKLVQISKEKPDLFTAEELKIINEYASTMEDLSDTMAKVGVKLAPIWTANIKALLDLEGALKAIKAGSLNDWAAGIINSAKGLDNTIKGVSNSISGMRETGEDYTNFNLSMIKSISEITISEENYREETDKMARSKEELEDKIRSAEYYLAKLNSTVGTSAGTIEAARRNVIELKTEYANMGAEEVKLAKDHEKANKQRILDIVLEQLQVGGLSNEERKRYIEVARGYGLMTQAAYDREVANIEVAASIVQSISDETSEVENLQSWLDTLVGKSPYYVDVIISGFPGANYSPAAAAAASSFDVGLRNRNFGNPVLPAANGLSGFIVPPGFPNDSFMVGLTSGERVDVTPQGENRGATVNIYADIKNLNDIDYLAQEVSRRIQ